MPLLGREEKIELQAMILDRLNAYWDARGPSGLLAPGVSLKLDAKGASIVPAPAPAAIATVEIRKLFTAVCHLSTEGPESLPRDSLDSLAQEAATALAAQVNRFSRD